jgi:hypothetical protein
MDKRFRSPNYPALSLPAALEKVATLYRNQHTHSAPREVVAQGMGYNSLNGASATAISALHKYGLVDRVGDELKVSERALRILHPHAPEEKSSAIRDAASQPQLFAELAERFPGAFPSDDLLRNYLIRRGFSSSAVTSVILAYRDTIELANAQSGEYAGSDNVVPIREGEAPMQPQVREAVGAPTIPQIQPNERQLASYQFEGGGYVRIIAGGDVDTGTALTMAESLLKLKGEEIKSRVAALPVVTQQSGVTEESEKTTD